MSKIIVDFNLIPGGMGWWTAWWCGGVCLDMSSPAWPTKLPGGGPWGIPPTAVCVENLHLIYDFKCFENLCLLTLGAPGICWLGPVIPGTSDRRGGTCAVGAAPPTYAPPKAYSANKVWLIKDWLDWAGELWLQLKLLPLAEQWRNRSGVNFCWQAAFTGPQLREQPQSTFEA